MNRASTPTLALSGAERRAIKRKLARGEAYLRRMAELSPAERDRGCRRWWQENVTMPGAVRRARGRYIHMTGCPTRPERSVRITRSKAQRRSTPARGDPEGDPDPDREAVPVNSLRQVGKVFDCCRCLAELRRRSA
jgi:hypothetical protein